MPRVFHILPGSALSTRVPVPAAARPIQGLGAGSRSCLGLGRFPERLVFFSAGEVAVPVPRI